MWRLDAGTVLSRLAAPCRLMRLCPLPNARKISQAECVCLIGGSYGTDPVDPKGSHPAAAVRKEQSGSFTLPHVHQIIRYCGSNGSFGLYTSQFTSFFWVSESQDSNSFFFCWRRFVDLTLNTRSICPGHRLEQPECAVAAYQSSASRAPPSTRASRLTNRLGAAAACRAGPQLSTSEPQPRVLRTPVAPSSGDRRGFIFEIAVPNAGLKARVVPTPPRASKVIP